MKPGLQEIILIIVIITAAAVITRIIQTGRGSARRNKASSANSTAIKPGLHRFLSRAGWTSIIAGILLLLAAISMFKWAFQSYLLASIIIAIGCIIVFLSRKKR
ncbi:hypothetical protein ACFLV0_00910 [Chloroflexota bacterium]